MTASPDTTLSQALLHHQAFVQALARQLTSDPHEADDLVQEANLIALRKRPHSSQGLRPWLASVLKSSLWTRRRAAVRAGERERFAARQEALEASPLARRFEREQEIVQAVLSLREPYRGTVLLRYYEEASLRTIAERQGVPLETARTRLRRAHDELRRRLGNGHPARRALMAAPVAKLAWAAGIAVVGAGAWIGSSALQDGRGPSVVQPVSLVEAARVEEPDGVDAPLETTRLAVTSGVEDERDAHLRMREPAREAYWEAVLRQREAAVRFSLEEVVPAEDLRLQERVDTLQLPGFFAGEEPGLSARGREIEALTGIRVVVPPRSDQEAVLDVQLDHPIRLADLLGLLAHEAGPEIDWSVHAGAIHIGLADRVQPEPIVFYHSVADFLVDPDNYFASEDERYPIFGQTGDGDILTLVKESVKPLSWEYEGVSITLDTQADSEIPRQELAESFEQSEFVPQSLQVRHSARVHEEIQRTLDHLRAFFLPDPEHARPGTPVAAFVSSATPQGLILERKLESTRLTVAYAGATWDHVARDIELATGIEVYRTTPFRESQAEHPVNLHLSEASVRDILFALEGADERFRWRLAFGLLVFEQGPRVFGGRQRLLLRDVRDLFRPPTTTVGDLPFEGERPAVWNGVEGDGWNEPLTPDLFAEYLLEHAAPRRWDGNSANRLRLSDGGVMYLTHAPRVLNDVERLLATLRSRARPLSR